MVSPAGVTYLPLGKTEFPFALMTVYSLTPGTCNTFTFLFSG
jgi:hypothetical protein